MAINLVMPRLGESVIEGTITKWLVREGDVVRREQAVVEVSTDKADNEVPSPEGGRITRILVHEGDTVKVGAPLAEIEAGVFEVVVPSVPAGRAADPSLVPTVPMPKTTEDAAAKGATKKGASTPPPAAQISSASASGASAASGASSGASAASSASASGHSQGNGGQAMGSPLVRKLALEHGVDIETVQGSGARGRLTTDDVLRAASGKSGGAAGGVTKLTGMTELSDLLTAGVKFPIPNVGYGSYKVPVYTPQPGDEVVQFTRRRRLTADHMIYAKLTAPHVVTVAEIDLYKTMKLREAHKDAYKKSGVSLTILGFVCAAAVRALGDFPALNSRVLDDSFVKIKNVNLGVAVDAPDGLIVPNIKKADQLSVRGLAKAIDEVATRARAGKITADDLAGGSFSITNPGIKGNLFGGAIIAQPNVGILRMGEIQKRPVVIEVEGSDTIAIHPVMYMALSYDHRIIDGVLANAFLWRVTELLEKGDFEV